jgi:Thioredoxin
MPACESAQVAASGRPWPDPRALAREVDLPEEAPSPAHARAKDLGSSRCPDVYNNLPVVARIAMRNPSLQLRIFPRDRHHDLMQRYLFRGQSQSIPAFGFFDEGFQEFATHAGARPKMLWDWMDQLGRDEGAPGNS